MILTALNTLFGQHLFLSPQYMRYRVVKNINNLFYALQNLTPNTLFFVPIFIFDIINLHVYNI